MGVYDSVYLKCLNCGGRVEAQSKGGHCELFAYEPGKVPLSVAGDLGGHESKCRDCGTEFLLCTPATVKVWLQPKEQGKDYPDRNDIMQDRPFVLRVEINTLEAANALVDEIIDEADRRRSPCLRDDLADNRSWVAAKIAGLAEEE